MCKSRLHVLASGLVLSGGLLLALTAVSLGGEENTALLDHLKECWEHERTGVVTCQLTFRTYRFGNSQQVALPKASFEGKFRALSLDDFARKLSEIEAMLPAGKPRSVRIWGQKYLVYQEGRKLRNEMGIPGQEQGLDVYLFNGTNEFSLHKEAGFKQVNIRPSVSGIEATRLEDYRFVPYVTALTRISSIKTDERGRAWLKVGRMIVCSDPTTGFVSEATDGQGGKSIEHAWYQSDPLRLKGDFYVPQVVALVFYKGGQLDFFSICRLESAKVNVSLDSALFEKLDIPEGTVVVDHRPGAVQIPRKNSKEFGSTSELLKAADTPMKPNGDFSDDEPEPRSFVWLWVLLIVFGLAAVVSGILIRRQVKSRA